MNKKIVGLVMAGVVLAGCQNIQDQMGQKLAEGMINSATGGQVKVNLDDAKNGKMTIQTKDGNLNMSGGENGGSLTMTDANGKTVVNASGDGKNVTINSADGKTVIKGDEKSLTMTDDKGNTATYKNGGEGRPADVPADMPTIDGGDFNFFTYGGMTSVTFAVEDKDFKAVCAKETSAVEGAGWAKDANGMSLEGSDTVVKSYAKGNDNLVVSCGLNDEKTTIGLQKTAKSS